MHGQKKRRKRSLTGTVTVDGFDLCWELRSEPQYSTEHGYEGVSIEVERVGGSSRRLILAYPFPKKRKRRFKGIDFDFWLEPSFPLRPDVSKKQVEEDIRNAISAGWDPASRGRPFIFQVPEQ